MLEAIQKITDNSNEMSFHGLMSQSAQMLVPLFQRPYVWKAKQQERMQREIDDIVDGSDSTRFLGAVIAVRRLTNPAQPDHYEIVDGQQRLTTMYLYLAAAAYVAERNGHHEYAAGIINTTLIVPWVEQGESNTKIVPSINDRSQFKRIYDYLYATGKFGDWLPLKARPPAASGDKDGYLWAQFQRIRLLLTRKYNEGGFKAMDAVVDAIRTKLTFVFILLRDGASATTVFQGLNEPGLPIGVGDLVKNEVFARIGDDPAKAKHIHDSKWLPFQDKLGEQFEEYFFPYCVVHRSSASRTEMFTELREFWGNKATAEDIIQRLVEYEPSFVAIRRGECPETYSSAVIKAIIRMVELGRPASVYPFAMRLLREHELGNVQAKSVIDTFDVLDSFLVRRAVCGIEPTGLLGMFRTMWSGTDGKPSADSVAGVINKRLTVEWPSDSRFKESILGRPLYSSAIARYVLLEFERSLGADVPSDPAYHVEHILPQSLTEEWKQKFTDEQHKKLANTWANLVVLSQTLNQSVQQQPYSMKRVRFAADSMYAGARRVAEQYADWTPETLANRADKLAEWAIKRWPKIEVGTVS